MTTSIFDIKELIPDDHLSEALGDSKKLWDQLEIHILENLADIKKEWKFYSKKAGWALVFKKKNRTLLYLTPSKDYFKVWFVFGEKASSYAKETGLPQYIIDAIFSAIPYVEGRLFSVDVKDDEHLSHVLYLLKIKDET